MLLSDLIAKLIEDMLEEQGGSLELQRNDMAMRLGCAPSQINYVITSRFTPQHGYLVESHRGGGGYIRIVRKQMHPDAYLMHFLASIGTSLSESEAKAMLRNLFASRQIPENTALMLVAAASNTPYGDIEDKVLRDRVRANVLRQLILSQMESR